MGLKQDFKLEYGLLVKDVYMRVVINYADSEKVSYHFELYYKDKGERKRMHTITHNDFTFTPNLAGPNFLEQAYTHAKGLPALAGAADEQD